MAPNKAPAGLAYVRTDLIDDMDPPTNSVGPIAWMRNNLFSSIGNTIITLVCVLAMAWAFPNLWGYLVSRSLVEGVDARACRAEDVGACWIYIVNRWDFFVYGFYPQDQWWRPNLFFLMGIGLIVPLLSPQLPYKGINLLLFLVAFPIVSYLLMAGGIFGLSEVPTENWGGMIVTIIVALTGIVASLPLGIVLALGRRSNMPLIKTVCVMFIELWRAVPLITVLFMASIMLPLFLPEGTSIDKLLRALVGTALFSAAYMAEVVRGGLQAIPKGQYEAAQALGLNYWKTTFFISMPQALKISIPGIVNTFIGLFKDTTLVAIVGLVDFLGAVKAGTKSAAWSAPSIPITSYVFAGIVYWIFCFSMSRYANYMENRLDTGHKN